MKTIIKVEKEVDIRFLRVEAGARYWEDSTVDGIEDTEGDLIPCREGDYWCPVINVDEGKIINWHEGKTADIHYKVCDNGSYSLLDENMLPIIERNDYVPAIMCPSGSGYGDYIIMKIDEKGIIKNWSFDLSDFIDED